ncbi:hypothetical protein EB796_016762 [Bugula neritina]|uniref:G-protein coupled receptors family 1 profile domain-containing protein n=1 Tax=Bugula neritina TaxID=10212 RepID=A0A7J7JFM4_BUGNE|nr:hypothetical protein EB796_016762 [Bugula neritina]
MEGLSDEWNLTDSEMQFAKVNNIVYYSVLLPVALCGNIFTLSAVFMVLRIKKSIPNMLIGVLAFGDLTSILTCHLISIISMSQGKLVGGASVCRFQSVMMFSYFKLGFFSKTCISIDRLIALKFPLKYRSLVTTKRVLAIIIFNVIFSIGSSALTWIIDGEYISKLETWYMCTNEFHIYTHYKLAVVIGEGTVFLIGVVIFLVGNITVVKVMLKVSRRIKSLKANNGVLNKLKMAPLSVVSTAPVGFHNISVISEIAEDKKNNNDSGEEDHLEHALATPLSKRALKKLNSNQSTNSDSESQTMTPSTISYTNHLSLPEHKNSNQLAVENTNSLPTDNAKDKKDKKKSIFKKVVEKSSRALSSSKQHRQKKELQFAKLVLVIVTVFVILWIPYMVG